MIDLIIKNCKHFCFNSSQICAKDVDVTISIKLIAVYKKY